MTIKAKACVEVPFEDDDLVYAVVVRRRDGSRFVASNGVDGAAMYFDPFFANERARDLRGTGLRCRVLPATVTVQLPKNTTWRGPSAKRRSPSKKARKA